MPTRAHPYAQRGKNLSVAAEGGGVRAAACVPFAQGVALVGLPAAWPCGLTINYGFLA